MTTLFPAVKAVGEGLGDRIFYLTAKTITAAVSSGKHRLPALSALCGMETEIPAFAPIPAAAAASHTETAPISDTRALTQETILPALQNPLRMEFEEDAYTIILEGRADGILEQEETQPEASAPCTLVFVNNRLRFSFAFKAFS